MYRSHVPTALATLLFAAATATAQGTFVNFETPQVHPITTAVVGGTEYLLACNTPDHFVEIYDPNTATPGTAPTYVGRVRVGQAPASVRFDPVHSCFYTANYIGDSVTKVELSTNGGGLTWDVVATKPVGESPADIAISADGGTLYVTLADASRLATLNASNLVALNRSELMMAPAGGFDFAVKEPRRIEQHDGAIWVANMKGGNLFAPFSTGPVVSQPYDLDLWTRDGTTERWTGGLGTQNAGMTFGVDGKLYLVGSLALNDVRDEPELEELAAAGSPDTGFVESWLWIVDPAGTAPTLVDSRDLNLEAGGGVTTKIRACSQPMDVVLLDDGEDVTKIYIATFSSDRLVVLTPNGGGAATWTRTLVGLTITPTPNDYGRNGPRGLVVNGDQTRLYCLNRLSNSISVVDLSSDLEAVRFPLQSDITPPIVREGRRFLYSAEFSGNATVSCSSCHVDARTDALAWDLGTPADGPVPHPVGLDDVVTDPANPGDWSADKEFMVTQSLQGLVNHPMNVEGQDFFTNKPYHWRGDRADFNAFNGAFVKLMGATNIGTPEDARGITLAEMDTYRDFINTVMYTPNPEQAHDRVFRGQFGTANSMADGTGASRGLKAFHIEPLARTQGRSCCICHYLPDGSNNMITEASGVGGAETAALRSLFSREGRAEEPSIANQIGSSSIFTSHFGLIHNGAPAAIHSTLTGIDGPTSIDRFKLDLFDNLTTNDVTASEDIAHFVREMDSGIAPSIGVTHTVTAANQYTARTTAAFDLLESQVEEANCGFAINSRIGGVELGFYYDITASPPGYRGHGSTTVISRATLLSIVTANDVLVLQGTPAGSERRIASANGVPGTLTGAAPSNISLEAMRPATHWANVPTLTKNWDPMAIPPNNLDFIDPQNREIFFVKKVRLLQRGLIQFAPSLGLTNLRHEAPRRFAVAGDDIRHGARLLLRVPTPGPMGSPPPYTTDLEDNTTLLDMQLFPTDQFVGEQRIWETTVEADGLVIYTLLMGGPDATGVAEVLHRPWNVTEPEIGSPILGATTYPAGTFDPLTWNQFHVTVVNEDLTQSAGAWMTLTIQ